MMISPQWIDDIRQHTTEKNPPVVLVGTKTDLRSDPLRPSQISRKMGYDLACDIKAHSYRECSAKNDSISCQDVMTAVIEAYLNPEKTLEPKRCPCCNIL